MSGQNCGYIMRKKGGLDMWQDWVNFIIGVIIFVAALAGAQSSWIYWLGGLLVAIFAVWSALAKQSKEH